MFTRQKQNKTNKNPPKSSVHTQMEVMCSKHGASRKIDEEAMALSLSVQTEEDEEVRSQDT